METDENNHIVLRSFFEKYSFKIQNAGFIEKSREYIDQYPLLPSQAIYITDMKELSVTYQRGIKRLLGYPEEEFCFDLLMQYYHPDDFNRYVSLVKIVNEWVRKNKPEPFTVESSFDYRLRKKDGTYLKVLRQSTVFENCPGAGVKSSFSILSDISRIKTNTSVNLSLFDVNSGDILFEDREKSAEQVKFTKREKEILLKIKQGLDSKSIAKEFECSKHTVDTHHRKMLQKSGCKNTMELINFCTRLGVI